MNNILKITQEFCIEVNKTNSTSDKKEVLKKYSELQNLLEYVYSPFKQFYVTSDNLKKNKDLKSSSYFTNIFDLLDDLSQRKITGHEAIANCNSFIDTNKEYESLIYNIIDKDLKCRIGEKIINSVFPECIPTFEVALANKFQDYSHKIDFINENWYASHKLDGIRCLSLIDNQGDVSLYSRQGKEFETLNILKEEIQKLNLKNVVLDGEVCIIDENGKENFQNIMKLIRRKDFTIENPMYLVFDYIDYDDFFKKESLIPFNQRYMYLRESLKEYKGKNIKILKQTLIRSNDMLKNMMYEARENKWEGLILRRETSYKGKRSNDILKVKDMYDAEYKVIDVEMGPFRIIEDGKEITIDTLSAIKIKHKENIVSVGSGFTIEERKRYYENPDLILEKEVTVQYFEETIDQNGNHSLRFPVFKTNHGEKRII